MKSFLKKKREKNCNIRNGFNFARKVIATGECNLLILDGVLGVVERNIVGMEDFEKLINGKADDMELILTGRSFPEQLRSYVDVISTIDYLEVDKGN